MYFHDEGSAQIGHNNNFLRSSGFAEITNSDFENKKAEFSFGKADRKH